MVGSPVSNVANTFLSCTKDSRGDTYTVASGVTNYSDHAANMEITLYEGKKILEVRTLSLAADETYTCLFKQVNWGKPAAAHRTFRSDICRQQPEGFLYMRITVPMHSKTRFPRAKPH